MARIPSGHWWTNVQSTFNDVLRIYIGKAQAAEKRESKAEGNEHDCGHQWEINIRSAMHSGIVGEGASSHHDADWWGDYEKVTVRAHDLRTALLVAATLPITAWFDSELSGEADR